MVDLRVVLALLAVLVCAVGVQTYRLQGAQDRVALLEEEKLGAERQAAQRALHDAKNKERTDAEYSAARSRAAVAAVVPQPTVAITTTPVDTTPSGDDSTICVEGGQLAGELTGFLQRHAARLTGILAGVSQRHAARLAGDVRATEEVAAAYRACGAFVLNLSNVAAQPAP